MRGSGPAEAGHYVRHETTQEAQRRRENYSSASLRLCVDVVRDYVRNV
jgi:hypothetical protein